MERDVDLSRTLLYAAASISIQASLLAVVYFKFMYDSEFIPMPNIRMKHIYNTLIMIAIIFIILYDRPANTINRISKMIRQLVDSARTSAVDQPMKNTTEAPIT
ncbi:uncharacterized protein LOC119655460 [Hermetia illucens]|nr:uncharacterized protein LOC119655460 [Hermetia illucens]XP_037917289.1 uncharacterized protein LOC119655460 [Hermetia illucens]